LLPPATAAALIWLLRLSLPPPPRFQLSPPQLEDTAIFTTTDTAVWHLPSAIRRFNSILAVISLPPHSTIAVSVERHCTSPTPSNAIVHLRRWTPMTIVATRCRRCLDLIVASLFAPTVSLSSNAATIGRCRR
jgi:hypothetical protein